MKLTENNKLMVTRYQYTFGDGKVVEFTMPLPFGMLKLCVDYHKGLVACKKIERESEDE